MFVVYWLEGLEGLDALDALDGDARHGPAHFERFGDSGLTQALAFAEALRKRQAMGEDVGFVSLCSENPNSVGKAGAAEPPADYAWKKRRR
ncbi:hypothetical protein [Paraburkholderia sp. 2C]